MWSAMILPAVLLALSAARCARALRVPGHLPRSFALQSQEEDRLSSYPSWLNVANLSLPLPSVSLPSFVGGAVFGVSALVAVLFLPILSSEDFGGTSPDPQAAQAIERPVALFEDILRDLSSSYVEDVNPNRLFETAVGSMLRSLDPYTEFENIESSKSL